MRAVLVALARAPVIVPIALIAGWAYPEWLIVSTAIGNEGELSGFALIQAIPAGLSVWCLLYAAVGRPSRDESPDPAAKAWAGAIVAAAAWGVIVIGELIRRS